MRNRRRVPWTVAAGLVGALGLTACESKTTAPPPPVALPPLDPSAAPAVAGERPVHPPSGMAGELPPSHPPVGDPHGMPPSHPAIGDAKGMPPSHPGVEPTTPADIPFDPKSVIAGELRLAPALKDKVSVGDTIFLMVRTAGMPGPPLAVRKLTSGTWPLSFTIDSRDAMVPGTKLDGKVTVSARVDKDGDAISKNPGDVVGASEPLAPPQAKVIVNLDKVL